MAITASRTRTATRLVLRKKIPLSGRACTISLPTLFSWSRHPEHSIRVSVCRERIRSSRWNSRCRKALQELSTHFFYHRHDELWEKEALRKLPVLQAATDMLVCGEDLGMVPHCVPGVMQRLGMLSLEVLPMPKQPGQMPAHAPYLSVVTPSTHDMSTLRGYAPGREEEIARLHLQAPAMWCILQLQDWLALDSSLPHRSPAEERINVPAITPWYWRYRMPVTLEALCAAQMLNGKIRAMVQESGR